MSAKIGTVRMERNRAIQGQKDMRKTNKDLQRQLAEVTRERDTLKAMVDLHDAMNDRRRAQANETPFKRRTYENG